MNRRGFLASLAACGVGTAAGCVADGRVVHQRQRSVDVDPGGGWVFEIDGLEGNGSVSYTVQADRRFDVYYFADPAAYRRYQEFLAGESPAEMPSGHDTLSRAAVRDGGDAYEAAVPEDGGRQSVTAEETHYFVVDHSNYGMGVPVPEDAVALDAFVDLTVYANQLPL
jgi:hypothetical protein